MNRTLQELTKVSTERKSLLTWLANELLQEWGLTEKGWTFIWGNKKRAFGTCRYRPRTIELSLYLLPTIHDEEAEDTIRHEIAHALDFEDRGTSDHSWRWKAWAVKVGANPERCGKHTNEEAREAIAYKSKYRFECSTCGHVRASHRRQPSHRRTSCEKCYPHAYREEFRMTQIENAPDNIPQKFGGNAPDPQ